MRLRGVGVFVLCILAGRRGVICDYTVERQTSASPKQQLLKIKTTALSVNFAIECDRGAGR